MGLWDETRHRDLCHKHRTEGNPRDSLVSHWDFGMRRDIGISAIIIGLKGILGILLCLTGTLG